MSTTTESPLKLMILAGGEIGKVFTLEKPELSIGRAVSSDICLDDSRLSHHHARILLGGGKTTIEDLDSTNGTFVNSQFVKKADLKEKDVIKVGRTLLTLTTASDISEVDIHELSEVRAEVESVRRDALPGQTIEMALPELAAKFEKPPSGTELDTATLIEIQRKLFSLYRISKEIGALFDMDALCEMIMKIIFNEIRSDRGVIMLRNDETGRLEASKTRISRSAEDLETTIQVSETIVNHVLETRNAVLTEDATEDQRFQSGESIVMLGVRSVMCVPLIANDDILGLIYVDKLSREKVFTRDDLEFLTAICNQAAISICNSMLFEDVRSSNQELTSLNAELIKSNVAFHDANEKLQESYKELENAQQRLVQSEKMSSLGRLVAGIAHDLKNLIGAVYGYASLIKCCKDESKRDDLVQKLNKATDICARMVKDLLSFAREEKPQKEECDLNALVKESVELTAEQLGREPKLIVKTELEESLPRVQVDTHQMIRVFTNIITNSMQAMRDHMDEGTLTIRTSYSEGRAKIVFADTGPGMSQDNLVKVFDPFFTTKKEGRGTGLGLSLCHGIVTAHGGDISAKSEEGKGATFTIELPISH